MQYLVFKQALEKKVNELNLGDRIKIIHASAFDKELFDKKFDIILAEGLLNVIGFEAGLPILIKQLKDIGYLIIHDEIKNNQEKKAIFRVYGLELLSSFVLDESVWWDNYYLCMKNLIIKENEGFFEKEINEMIEFKRNPEEFRSVYYVLQYNGGGRHKEVVIK